MSAPYRLPRAPGRWPQPATLAVRPSNVSRLRPGALGVAAVLITLAADGCSPSPRCPPSASCPAPPLPRVTFTPGVNGKPAAPGKDGHVPSYRVRPGEYLVMSVTVNVPEHVKVTALWLGISKGTWGTGPQGPVGMNPVLAHYRRPLPAGSHTFRLRWRIPYRGSGASLYLTFAWSSRQPPAGVSGPVAQLIVN
jgi:hypothetical protein